MRALFTTARSAWSRRAAATCNEVPRTSEYRTHLINNVRKSGRTPPLLPDVCGDRARLPDIIIDDRRLNDDLDVSMLPISRRHLLGSPRQLASERHMAAASSIHNGRARNQALLPAH